jgi:hypothetical protein
MSYIHKKTGQNNYRILYLLKLIAIVFPSEEIESIYRFDILDIHLQGIKLKT